MVARMTNGKHSKWSTTQQILNAPSYTTLPAVALATLTALITVNACEQNSSSILKTFANVNEAANHAVRGKSCCPQQGGP